MLSALVVFALTGCASRVDVRTIGSGNAPPFYELRGRSLAALDDEAAVLCPNGFGVARRWQRLQAADSKAGIVSRYQMKAEDYLLPNQQDLAQMTIQCTTGQPIFVPQGAPAPVRQKASTVAVGPLEVVGDGAEAGAGAAKPLSDKPLPEKSATGTARPPAAAGSAAGKAAEAPAKPSAKAPPPPAAKSAERKTGAGGASPFSVPSVSSAGKGAM